MKILINLFVLLYSSVVFADAKYFYIQRTLRQHIEQKNSIKLNTTFEFDQKIDHFNSVDKRTFKQRYFLHINADADKKAPVILYICGESTCEGIISMVTSLARQLKGHAVALEHRYYGYSQPFPTLSTQNLKYLTLENAIEDLAEFQKEMMKNEKLQGPWVAVGGSYAGTLSAYYRLQHPELVVGSLASSAPVEARVNFEEYDLAVSQAITPVCANQIRSVVDQVEKSLQIPETRERIKKIFNASLIRDDVDFLAVVADMAAVAIQYGNKRMLCSALAGSPEQMVKAYADVGNSLFSQFGIDPVSISTQGAESENPNDYVSSFGMRAWYYQVCTQFGFFQTAHHDQNISVRSSQIDVEFYNQTCKRLFNVEPLDTTQINKKYFQNLFYVTTKNIVFTNGGDDPWKFLSISKDLGNDTNPNTIAFTIPEASHCTDLQDFNPSPSSAHAITLNAIQTWIK